MKMRRRSWRVLVSAGIPSMVCLAILIGNPDWPFMSNVGWALLNGLFIFPGLIAIVPLMFLTFGLINIHDYPVWMPETFGWIFWALSIYVALGFYYRAPSQGQSMRFVSSVINRFAGTMMVGAGVVLGIYVLGYVFIAWHLGTTDCDQWNTDGFFITARAETVTDCLHAGADLNARSEFLGETPLHAAGSNANPAVIAALLDAGADPNARSEYGETPLHKAASYNANPAVIMAVLDAGADPSARNEAGWTPLHQAMGVFYTDNSAVIATLLAAGADPNARAGNGWTPLHVAARYNGNPAVIAALLNAGADPSALDEAGDTPWDLAQENDAMEGTDALQRLNDAQFQ